MPYKTFTLTFAVLDDKSIKFLKKEEADKAGNIPPDAIEVYNKDGKKQDGITEVIEKHFKAEAKGDDTAEAKGNDSAVTQVAEENTGAVDGAVVNDNAVAENQEVVVETDNEQRKKEGSTSGGARRAYPKNVSFSKKYPKNKSNKKTLRNLQRKASH